MSNEILADVHSLLAQLQASDLDDAARDELERNLEKKYEWLILDILAADHEKHFSQQELKDAFVARGLEVGTKQLDQTLSGLVGQQRIALKGLRYFSIHPDVLDRQLANTPAPPAGKPKH